MRRSAAVAAALILLVTLAGCDATVAPSPTPAKTLTVSVPIPTTDKAVILAAIDVMSARLRSLGIGTFSSSAGSTVTFTVPFDGTVDQASIDAVLRTPGVFEMLGWTTGDPPTTGDPAPTGVPPLFDPAGQIGSARTVVSNGQTTVDLDLAADASKAVETFTTANIGDYIVLVMDGVVLDSPVVMSAIEGGQLSLTFPDSTALPLDALAAILASGPLPSGWINP